MLFFGYKDTAETIYIIYREKMSISSVPEYPELNKWYPARPDAWTGAGNYLYRFRDVVKKVIFPEPIIFNNIVGNALKAACFSNLFYTFSILEEIVGMENLDTSEVNNFIRAFYGCSSLKQIDLSHLNTKNATNMSEMFARCESLTELDVSHFNTNNVTDMSFMFSGCDNLTELDLSNFNTSNVVDMQGLFNWCPSLTQLDISNFNTNNVTNTHYMFRKCDNLTTIYVNDFNISAVTESSDMFLDSPNLVGAISYDPDKIDVNYANCLTGYFTHKTHKYINGVCPTCGDTIDYIKVKKQLRDLEENKVYPKTVAEAITDDNGNPLMSLVQRFTAGEGIEINNNEISVTYGFADRIKY